MNIVLVNEESLFHTGLTGGMQNLSLHQQQQSAIARPLGTASSQVSIVE